MKIDNWYSDTLYLLKTEGIKEVNRRTGKEVLSLPGITFQTDLEKDGFPLLSLRKINTKPFIEEMMWFLRGENNIETLGTRIWDSFAEEDGTVEAAYGFRWRHAFGRDQIRMLVENLKKDPSSRQNVVMTWDPMSDGLGDKPKLNIPCPYSFVVNIIGGRLHLHNIVRSNDFILGFPSDVAGFALLQMMLTQEAGIKPGVYTHSISHCHIYSDHYPAMEEMLMRQNMDYKIQFELPPDSLSLAINKNLVLGTEIRTRIDAVYKPSDPIRGLIIAL